MIAAALGTIGGDARRGRGVTRVVWFIVPPSGLDGAAGPPALRIRPGRRASSCVDRRQRGVASCLQFYAGVGDITATGDVGRMSCRPAHTGGMRVLVVEDHATLSGRIAQGLRHAGMAVDAAYDGAAALDATVQTAYDVIVLDR